MICSVGIPPFLTAIELTYLPSCSRSSSFRLLKNLQKDKKVDDKDRERELKEEQDDESRRLANEDVSEEAIIAEYGFHRVLDGNEGEVYSRQPTRRLAWLSFNIGCLQEKTILPHYAKRLDNNPTLQNQCEILISVQLLFLPERNLVVSLKKQGGDDLSKGIIKSLAEAGKIYAPPGEDVKDRCAQANPNSTSAVFTHALLQGMDRGNCTASRQRSAGQT